MVLDLYIEGKIMKKFDAYEQPKPEFVKENEIKIFI